MSGNDHHYHYGGGRSSSSGVGVKRERSPSPKGSHHHRHHYGGSGGSTHGSYHRHRDSETGRSSHSNRGGEETQYTVPSSAPLLKVPPDLPVDVTAFIDIVAFYVVQGGPTAEEGIIHREANNPHFAFLRGPWNDPQQLYYRWRLYSLLQGDTLLKWRTEPFQIERGRDAYVWVPPPPILSGPECLLGVTGGALQAAKGKPTSGGGRDTVAAAVQPKEPQPSAFWLSRMCVSEGTYFVALEKDEVQEWEALLAMDHIVAEVGAAVMTASHPLLLPSAGQSAASCGTTLEEGIGALAASLLNSERIAQRMVFAVEHQRAALHVMSFILDEVVRLAYMSTAAARRSGGTTANSTVRNSDSSANLSGDPAFLAAARCCMCLSYLFTLNDIGRNGGTPPLSDEELTAVLSSSGGNSCAAVGAPVTSGSSGKLPATDASATFSNPVLPCPYPRPALPLMSPSGTVPVTPMAASQNMRLLNRAVEKIMPTIIEATLLVALNTIREYGSLKVDKALDADSNEVKPPEAEGMEGILPMGVDHTAYLHVQARVSTGTASPLVPGLRKEDRDAVCMIGLLLLSWLKQLCSVWSDSDVIGSRCWSTLASKYNFLLSQTIETT